MIQRGPLNPSGLRLWGFVAPQLVIPLVLVAILAGAASSVKASLEVRPGLALVQCPGASAFLGRSTQLSSDRRDAADAVSHEWVRASADRAQVIASGAGKQVHDPPQGLVLVPMSERGTAGDQAEVEEGPPRGVVVLVEGVEALLRVGPGLKHHQRHQAHAVRAGEVGAGGRESAT